MSNVKRNALGRGLSALLQDAKTDITTVEANPVYATNEILISQIQANPFQPRTDFDNEALNELSESIRMHGVIQPITVRKMGYDSYQIISGERRTRASILAGLSKIPAYVRVANDQEMLEWALIENIQREELNPIEVAFSYKRLIDECNLKQEELAERVGKNRTTVNNFLRLLKLPDTIQVALKEGKITMGHARAIINIDDPKKQEWMLEQMLSEELSVREVEGMVRDTQEQEKKKKPGTVTVKSKSHEWTAYQKLLADKLNLPISIKSDERGRGAIKITFRSQSELESLLEMIG
jgi:ParB family transcriptional regulator, chromosome partitioning protein